MEQKRDYEQVKKFIMSKMALGMPKDLIFAQARKEFGWIRRDNADGKDGVQQFWCDYAKAKKAYFMGRTTAKKPAATAHKETTSWWERTRSGMLMPGNYLAVVTSDGRVTFSQTAMTDMLKDTDQLLRENKALREQLEKVQPLISALKSLGAV